MEYTCMKCGERISVATMVIEIKLFMAPNDIVPNVGYIHAIHYEE